MAAMLAAASQLVRGKCAHATSNTAAATLAANSPTVGRTTLGSTDLNRSSAGGTSVRTSTAGGSVAVVSGARARLRGRAETAIGGPDAPLGVQKICHAKRFVDHEEERWIGLAVTEVRRAPPPSGRAGARWSPACARP